MPHPAELTIYQVKSMKTALAHVLTYHHSNYERYRPICLDGMRPVDGQKVDVEQSIQSQIAARAESQAYLFRLTRLVAFIASMKKQLILTKPTDPDLIKVWSWFQTGGSIKKLRDKWLAHRSIDDPKGEVDLTHWQVVINLDGGGSMWADDHIIFMLDNACFSMKDHDSIQSFINWMFSEIENNLSNKKAARP